MDENDILAFVEDYVRQHGLTKISELGKMLGIGRKQLRRMIKSSSMELSVTGWYVKLREVVDSEFGEVTPEELELLRRYRVPTPAELEERKRLLLEQIASSYRSNDDANEASDMFVRLAQASVQFLTQLTKERTRQLALQLNSELAPRSLPNVEYDIYIYVCGRTENIIKGWAITIVSRGYAVHKLDGCLARVSIPYAYMSLANKALKLIPRGSKARILCNSKAISIIKKHIFRNNPRATFSEKEACNSLLSTMASYNVEFAPSHYKDLKYCRRMALKARQTLYLKGVRNGSI